ncbi:MAG: hypothetical protein E6J35_07680 [Chloroflexi bacterium]|nr:MAG: hypothetical protein E6J35_07680 [Chloroflexota bacterium]
MRQVLGYTLMLLRAYTRDFTALFFGFFFPLIFMGLFGILNFGSFGHVAVGTRSSRACERATATSFS